MKFVLHILLRACEYVVFYLGFLQIGLLCLLWSLTASVLRPLLPPAAGRLLGRAGIRVIFRVFLTTITLSGRFRFDLSELDAIKHEGGLIIAPNHPSLWDVALIVSRLPNVACIVKAEILDNIFLGGGSRLAGYISAEPLRRMITLAVDDLNAGGRLLLFPEGTRTSGAPIGPLIGSIGLVAVRAQAPVQTVLIETDSPFLGKGWPIHKVPRLPLSYRVRLGRRFEAPQNGALFMRELADYFAEALTHPPATLAQHHIEVQTN